jgi:signal transduction histidine kinase
MSIMRKDGSEAIIEFSSAVNRLGGAPTNILFIRDITEQQKMKQTLKYERDHYQSVFDNAPVSFWEADYSAFKHHIDILRFNGVKNFDRYWDSHPDEFITLANKIKLVAMNQEGLKSYGVAKKEDIKNYPYYIDTQNPAIYARVKLNIKLLSKGVTRFNYEWKLIQPGGDERYHFAQFAVIKGFESTWSRIFIDFIDITDQKKIENELRQYKEGLEQIVDARTRELRESHQKLEAELGKKALYTNALVHELKTPLTPMLGASELLASNITQEPYAGFAKNLNQGINNLNKRVNELLDLTRGEVGMLQLEFGTVDPRELILEVAHYMELEAKRYGHKLTVELPPSLPVITADRGRLQQVLLNLITNALKYSPDPDNISLKAFQEEDQLVFSVSDHGSGMNAEDLESVFQPYNRARQNPRGGLGLGLPLCKMLVELHGGKISIASRRGSGTTVSFCIPLNQNRRVNNRVNGL